MRLYTRTEFEEDIKRRWRLTPTDDETATTPDTARYWKTRGGCFITIPVLDEYPDYWLSKIRNCVVRSVAFGAPHSLRRYIEFGIIAGVLAGIISAVFDVSLPLVTTLAAGVAAGLAGRDWGRRRRRA